MSLPNLPKNYKKLNKSKSKPKLPGLPEDENLSAKKSKGFGKSQTKNNYEDSYDDSYEDIEKLMLDEELTEEYIRLKKKYKNIIKIFNQGPKYKKDINNYNFKSLDEFEKAIEDEIININNYSTKEISDLIKNLSELEYKIDTRNLEDYKFASIDEFQNAIEDGILNINNYDIDEITRLLDTLQYRTDLELGDYNITILGNVTIEEVKTKINNSKPNKSNRKETPKLPKQKESTSKENKPVIEHEEYKNEETIDHYEYKRNYYKYKRQNKNLWQRIKALFKKDV